MLSRLAVLLGLVASAMMLGSSCYQLAVDVPNWSSSLPDSSRAWARVALARATPTHFYQLCSVVALVSLSVSAVLDARSRAWKLIAIAALVSGPLVTVVLVFPRNDVLFFDGQPHTAEEVVAAARQWQLLHAGRILLFAAAAAASARAVIRA
jgi:hypothetical protein